MIVIIGAGITGLVLAHELARRGVEFVVLEAASVPGGVVRTIEVGGRLFETGPQRTRLVPAVAALVGELGLGDELVTAPSGLPLYVYKAGRLREVPFSIGAAFRTDLVSWPGKLRILFEPLTAGERPDESVAAFLTRKFGREAYESMLGPLYGGLYASDPADMLMRTTLSRALETFGVGGSLLAALARRARGRRPGRGPGPGRVRVADGGAPACSFRGGMAALPDALYRAHRDRVRLGAPARALRRDGGRWVVETDAGDMAADDVVLTVPADAAATLLAGAAPDAAARIGRLTYNPLAIVYLDAELDRPAMGYQVAFGEALETRGVTFNAHLFGRAGVYTAFLGGAKNPRLVDLPDDRLGDIAAAEFEAVTGRPARPVHVERVRMPAWDRSWTAIEGLTPPPGLHLAASWESRAGVPGRIARARELAAELA
ncbi:MAG TPA: protoporphyrinogen oxidase [Longimicrobiales bacterium]